MGQYDITIASANPSPTFATTSFRIEPDAIRQDITPASARRSDGDTRFLTIVTESFWAQNDWSAGLGRFYPPDPTSAEDLLSSVADSGRLTAPYAPQSIAATLPASCSVKRMIAHLGVLYAHVVTAGADKLYKYSGGSWSAIYTFPQTPTWLTSYRGDIWASYGLLFQTEKITTAGVNTGMGFNSQITCPYGSMIFYARFDSGSSTYRLNRYDPENTASVPDLAIFPLASSRPPLAICVLGPDLYIQFEGELWRFTSPNGNSGLLQGPVDKWVPTGPYGAESTGCRSLVVHQGALVFTTGATLRRYLPGGQGRTLWPVPGYDRALAENNTRGLAALCAVDDRLYLLGFNASSGVATYYDLYLWTGAGMQRVCRIPIAGGSSFSPTTLSFLVALGDGNVYWSASPVVVTGFPVGYVTTRDAVAIVYDTTYRTVYTSSLLDFGMLDIEKAISQFRVAAVVPAGQDVEVWVAADSASFVRWTKSGSFSATRPDLVTFLPPSGHVVVAERWQVALNFSMGGDSSQTPEVFAVLAIPNPVMPLRRGFRFTILLDESSLDHDGGRLYADSAAVDAALALVRQLRTEEHPLLLTWTDGDQYYVRINAQTEHRAATIGGDFPAWRVTCDAQEVT